MIKTFRDGARIYQTFQLQLFVAKLLFKSALFGIDGTELIENAVVGAAQRNGKYQNGCKVKDNKDKTKSRRHIRI